VLGGLCACCWVSPLKNLRNCPAHQGLIVSILRTHPHQESKRARFLPPATTQQSQPLLRFLLLSSSSFSHGGAAAHRGGKADGHACIPPDPQRVSGQRLPYLYQISPPISLRRTRGVGRSPPVSSDHPLLFAEITNSLL
jgi:hypothetical protein